MARRKLLLVADGKFPAAFFAAAGKNLAAILAAHAFTESVLVLPLAVAGLKRSLHDYSNGTIL